MKYITFTVDEILSRHSVFKFYGEYGAVGIGGDFNITYYSCYISDRFQKKAENLTADESEYECSEKSKFQLQHNDIKNTKIMHTIDRNTQNLVKQDYFRNSQSNDNMTLAAQNSSFILIGNSLDSQEDNSYVYMLDMNLQKWKFLKIQGRVLKSLWRYSGENIQLIMLLVRNDIFQSTRGFIRYFTMQSKQGVQDISILAKSDHEIVEFGFDKKEERFDRTCLQDFSMDSGSNDILNLLSNCGQENVRILDFNLVEDVNASTKDTLIEKWQFSHSYQLNSEFTYHDTDFSQLISHYNRQSVAYADAQSTVVESMLSSKICRYKDWIIFYIQPSDDSSLTDLGVFITNVKNRNRTITLKLKDYGFKHVFDLLCMPNNKAFALQGVSFNKKQIIALLKYEDIQDSRNRISTTLTANVEDYRSNLRIGDVPRTPLFSFSNFQSEKNDRKRYGNRIYQLMMQAELIIKDTRSNRVLQDLKNQKIEDKVVTNNLEMSLSPTKPSTQSKIQKNIEVQTIQSLDLKSNVKSKDAVQLKLDNKFKGQIPLEQYIQITGPIYDLFTAKVKDGKSSRLIGGEEVITHQLTVQSSDVYTDVNNLDLTDGVFFDGRLFYWAGPNGGGLIDLNSSSKQQDSFNGRKIWCISKYQEIELCNGKLRVFNQFVDLGSEFIVELIGAQILEHVKTTGSEHKILQVYVKSEGNNGMWIFNLKLDLAKGKESVTDKMPIGFIPEGNLNFFNFFLRKLLFFNFFQ